MNKKVFQGKRAFALFFTIFLVLIISILSYRVVENKIFLSNLNTLKYLHLQANIHMNFIKESIENSSIDQISQLTVNDNRFFLDLEHVINSDGQDLFYVVIETVDSTPVRLSKIIIK